jgi:hypothetical protein
MIRLLEIIFIYLHFHASIILTVLILLKYVLCIFFDRMLAKFFLWQHFFFSHSTYQQQLLQLRRLLDQLYLEFIKYDQIVESRVIVKNNSVNCEILYDYFYSFQQFCKIHQRRN